MVYNETNFQLCRESNQQKVVALVLDNYEHYVLTPKHVVRASPTLFEPKQIQSAQKLLLHRKLELNQMPI